MQPIRTLRALLAAVSSLLVLGLVFGFFPSGRATQTPDSAPKSSLPWKAVQLEETSFPLAKALESLRQQTEVTITNELGDMPTLARISLNKATFWQAADQIARGARGKISLSSRDGSVSLVRANPKDREPPTAYDGNFRVRLVRIQTSRDLTSDLAQCVCSLELVWTPTVFPLFIDSRLHQIQALDASSKAIEVVEDGGGLAAVDGRYQHSADLTLVEFPPLGGNGKRVLRQLSGHFQVVAPSRLLSYRFAGDLLTVSEAVPGGALRRLVESDVICKIDRVVLGRDRWTIQMGLEYPEGGRTLESFQASSLVVLNELRLVSSDGKRRLVPTSYVVDSVSTRRAQVSYHFTDQPRSKRGQPKGWQITYKAPERLIDVPVRFTFKDVLLP